ncbi:carbohydrate-binding WSC [Cladorrhinum sp. PSN259]|nr:carbohydrate-binding WSC [Cladorrhinum sp. PSN259]
MLLLSTLVLPILTLPFSTSAQQQSSTPQIVKTANKPARYGYLGCYNETTALAGTAGGRALYGGINLVAPDVLTVEKCWDFCATNNTAIRYKYAGLEYARECWCATSLSSLSVKVDDSACDLACEGNNTQVCGGNLKLTVYVAGAGRQQEVMRWAGAVVVMGVVGVVSGLV